MTDPTRTVMNIPRLRDTLNRERKVAEDEGLYFFKILPSTYLRDVILHLRKYSWIGNEHNKAIVSYRFRAL